MRVSLFYSTLSNLWYINSLASAHKLQTFAKHLFQNIYKICLYLFEVCRGNLKQNQKKQKFNCVRILEDGELEKVVEDEEEEQEVITV